jgi:hypothetical protein
MKKSASPRISPEDPDILKLSDYLCFAVYSANLAFGKAYKPILDKLGLTYTQYITVIALWENDNQTVSGLGEKLFLESNTLTPILKKLEAMGYLRRQRDAHRPDRGWLPPARTGSDYEPGYRNGLVAR